MKSQIVLIIMVLSVTFSFSQNKNMENNIDEIKLLGKEGIIQLAFKIIKEKELPYKINPEDYKITVWANKTEVLVKLNRLIKYVPLGSNEFDYEYNMSVNIINHKVDPFESILYKNNFYTASKADKKNIEFLKKHTTLPYSGFENTIVETENTFEIHINNDTNIAIIYIDKTTGKELPGLSGHNMPPPMPEMPIDGDENILKEITE